MITNQAFSLTHEGKLRFSTDDNRRGLYSDLKGKKSESQNNFSNKLVLQEGPRLEIPKRATRSCAGTLVVLICGPSESTSRWTTINRKKF